MKKLCKKINGNYVKNRNISRKNTKVLKTNAKMFAKAIAKIHQERLNFENTRRIFNKGLIRPIDGLSRNIKRQDV